MLRSLLREPLVYFLVLGAALFALDVWWRLSAAAGATPEIVVSEARVNNLAQNFRRTWQRPPTREELAGLVEDHVREEVLYREALAVGLDRDDTIIRRRLRQKMEFVSDEAAGLTPPTEEQLVQYLAAHPEAFGIEPRVTFTQVYFDPQRRGKSLEADAQQLIAKLERAGPASDPASLSDSRMLESRFDNVSRSDVAKVFGVAFADALVQQPTGRWVGPLRSGYGAHFVRLDSLTPGGVVALEAARPLVEREWSNARRKELREAYYAQQRGKYNVRIALPASPAASDGKPPTAMSKCTSSSRCRRQSLCAARTTRSAASAPTCTSASSTSCLASTTCCSYSACCLSCATAGCWRRPSPRSPSRTASRSPSRLSASRRFPQRH